MKVPLATAVMRGLEKRKRRTSGNADSCGVWDAVGDRCIISIQRVATCGSTRLRFRSAQEKNGSSDADAGHILERQWFCCGKAM